MELKENTYIDISDHIFYTTIDETRTTSRAKLIFPSLLMRLFRLKGDEEEGDQEEGAPMEAKTEVARQPSSSRGRGKRSKASSSPTVPSYAFQIILERIDGLRDVQNEQYDKLATLQD